VGNKSRWTHWPKKVPLHIVASMLFVGCLFSAPEATAETDFFVAGVPKALGVKPNFDAIFGQLKSAGVNVFMPFSEYQELPAPKSLDYEKQFYPQFKTDDNAINALQRHGIKLLVPGAILYPDGKVPPLSEDPLKKLLAWVGRKNVYGVYTFDEPVLNKTTTHCNALYKRVKEVDPSLPVVMIHSPIPETITTKPDVGGHLDAVKNASQFADVVGFDVYAIPKDLMKVQGPYSGPGAILDYRNAIAEYSRWLKENLPSKKHMIVLQAFSLRDQGHPFWLAKLYGDRRPTKAELQGMVNVASGANDSVGWWGQSLVKDTDMRFWNDILDATRAVSLKGKPDRASH
jgi:hypothetical protein